jgi:hypothetical protein
MAHPQSIHPDHGEPHAAGHEASDVNVRGVFAAALGLLVVALIVYGVVWGFFGYLSAAADRESATRLYPLAAGQEDRLPPEPRLQTNPRQDLGDLRTSERELLEGYHWVDRNAGIVRIPIEEAMRLTIERGLPSRPAPNTAAVPQGGAR